MNHYMALDRYGAEVVETATRNYVRDQAGFKPLLLFRPFSGSDTNHASWRTQERYLEEARQELHRRSATCPVEPSMSINLVKPKVFWVGYTDIRSTGLMNYLGHSGNEAFAKAWIKANQEGLSEAEILCSVFAKLCYKSLTVGKNPNITKTRDIYDNLVNCFESGHSSVFRHVNFNFIVTDCSRIFTHEQVRHSAGTAYSETSGRYCQPQEFNFILPPELEDAEDIVKESLEYNTNIYTRLADRLGLNDPDKTFMQKKKITSAMRRLLVEGLSTEIAVTANLQSIRHMVMMRTSRHAEWEIRTIYEQIYNTLKSYHPLLFHGATETEVDGVLEVSGLKTQPYEQEAS